MTPLNGNPKSIKLDPDDPNLFGWLDDDETLDQPKKRLRSTLDKSDGSKNTTQAKINDTIIATAATKSSSNTAIPSSSIGESRRLKTVTPTKLESGTNNKTQEPPEKQKKSSDKAPEKQKNSSDKALDIASKKGKRLRDMRQERHEQHNQQQQLAVRKKGSEYCRSFDLLPAEPLKHVASYLAAPSRALFDMALNGDMDGPGDNRRGVTGVVDILDFGEIEKSLANKLRDWHLKEILLRIDAVNNLKRLRLTNCIEIRGHGLVPLSGSRIIEQIDLSIATIRGKGVNVFRHNPPKPQILFHEVQPILDSIIQRERCSLKHLQFSKVSPPNTQFVSRYTEMLRRRNRRCPFEFRQWNDCLVQEGTCYGCLKHFPLAPWPIPTILRSCICSRFFCQDCRINGICSSPCGVCTCMFCIDCKDNLSDCCSSECDRKVCGDCILVYECYTCKGFWCKRCTERRNVEQYGINGAQRFENEIMNACASCFQCDNCDNPANPENRCDDCIDYFCNKCFGAEGNAHAAICPENHRCEETSHMCRVQ